MEVRIIFVTPDADVLKPSRIQMQHFFADDYKLIGSTFQYTHKDQVRRIPCTLIRKIEIVLDKDQIEEAQREHKNSKPSKIYYLDTHFVDYSTKGDRKKPYLYNWQNAGSNPRGQEGMVLSRIEHWVEFYTPTFNVKIILPATNGIFRGLTKTIK